MYAPNTIASKKLKKHGQNKSKIDNSTIIVKKCYTLFWEIDRTLRPKKSGDIEELNTIQLDWSIWHL